MTEPFLKTPLSLYRTGIISVIGHNLVTVYNALRCYIFRSQTQGTLSIQKLTQEGHLVAEVSQGKLARILGMKRQTVNKLLQQLSVLGWIQYDSLEIHRVCTYVLGYWNELNDKKEEIFYSDLYLKDLEENIERAIKNRRIQLPLYNKNEHTANENYQEEEFKFRLSYISNYIASTGKNLISSILKNKNVTVFSIAKPTQRVLKNSDFLQKIYSVGAATKTTCAPKVTAACTPRDTNPVPQGDLSLYPSGNTEYITLKEKNREEKKNKDIDHTIHNIILDKLDLDVGSLFIEMYDQKIATIKSNLETEILAVSDSKYVPEINEGQGFKNELADFNVKVIDRIEKNTTLDTEKISAPVSYVPLFSGLSGNNRSSQVGFSILASDEFYTKEGFNKIIYGSNSPVIEPKKEVELVEEVVDETPLELRRTPEAQAEANKWATMHVANNQTLYAQWRGETDFPKSPNKFKKTELTSEFDEFFEDHEEGEVSDVDAPDEENIRPDLLAEYFEHEKVEIAPKKKEYRTEEEIKSHWLKLYAKNFPELGEYNWTKKDTALIARLANFYRTNGGLGCVFNYVSFIFHMWNYLVNHFDFKFKSPSVSEVSGELHNYLFKHMFKIQKHRKYAEECEAKFKAHGSLPFEDICNYEEALKDLQNLGVTTWTNKIS